MPNLFTYAQRGSIGFFFTLILLTSLTASGWLYLEYLDRDMNSGLNESTIETLTQRAQKGERKVEELRQVISEQKSSLGQSQQQNNQINEQLDTLNQIQESQQILISDMTGLRHKLTDSEQKLTHKQSQLDRSLTELATIKQKSVIRAEEILNREKENEALRKQLSNTDIRISDLKSRFTVFEMQQEILFNRGDATLKPDGQKALASLARIFEQFPDRQIAIQGHSDNQNLSPETQQNFATNWELSAARAASAIHYLQGTEGIKPQRMILVSYAQYRPINSNQTKKGRASNRRIEIILMPRDFDFFRETTDEL